MISVGALSIHAVSLISTAFDMINHKILFDELYYYGIIGVLCKLLSSYLSERCQLVQKNKNDQDPHWCKIGYHRGWVSQTITFLIPK